VQEKEAGAAGVLLVPVMVEEEVIEE